MDRDSNNNRAQILNKSFTFNELGNPITSYVHKQLLLNKNSQSLPSPPLIASVIVVEKYSKFPT